MLIHTYFTDGFLGFGKLFIRSFRKFHGQDMPMVLTTRNLNENQINKLKQMYKNLTVLNKEIDIKELSRRTNIDIQTLLRCKKEIEYKTVNRGNVIWKQFVSVEDRYRNSILEAMEYAGNEEFMMHIDADSYVRKSLDPLFKLIMENDVTLIFKLNRPSVNRKIFGSLSGYRLGEKSRRFLKAWRKYIDEVPLCQKPKGYGQAACFYAYEELKDSDIKWGEIPGPWVNSKLNEKALIWGGNHARGKVNSLNLFESDYANK